MIPCKRDGYSRINAIPTLSPTYAPTYPNTIKPTFKPSVKPTITPTIKPTIEPSYIISTHPTKYPSNSSITTITTLSSSTSSTFLLTDYKNPITITIFGLVLIVIIIIILIFYCEHKLSAEKIKNRAEKKAKREADRIATELLLQQCSSPPSKDNNNNVYSHTLSPLKKMFNWKDKQQSANNSNNNNIGNGDELEVIL